jgi:hypothetical protein
MQLMSMQTRRLPMTGKMILIASVILLALPGSAVACAAKVHLHGSVVRTASQAEDHANAYNWAVPISTAEPKAYRYHGGPKSNDTLAFD